MMVFRSLKHKFAFSTGSGQFSNRFFESTYHRSFLSKQRASARNRLFLKMSRHEPSHSSAIINYTDLVCPILFSITDLDKFKNDRRRIYAQRLRKKKTLRPKTRANTAYGVETVAFYYPNYNSENPLKCSFTLPPSFAFTKNYIQKNSYSTSAVSPTNITDPESSPWNQDEETELNKETYLKTISNEIEICYNLKDYSKINSLYQALKRNNIVPSSSTFVKVLSSIWKRDFDTQELDYKMFQILSCYEDIVVKNKLKPTDEVYDTLLLSLFNGSIMAHRVGNANGQDFFKIALEILREVSSKYSLSQQTVKEFLLAINIYPGYINMRQLEVILDQQKSFVIADTFIYKAVLAYSKAVSDKSSLLKYFDGFSRLQNLSDFDKPQVYALTISGLVEMGDLQSAITMLDDAMEKIREQSGVASYITLILSSFLISLSKIDAAKAYELWCTYHNIPWVPEFPYDFYLKLLSHTDDWSYVRKIYSYLIAMDAKDKKLKINSSQDATSFALFAAVTESEKDMYIRDQFLRKAINGNDNEIVAMLLQESMVKGFFFKDVSGTYSSLFRYLVQKQYPAKYLIKLIQSHAILISSDAAALSSFLNAVADNIKNSDVLYSVSQMDFFLTYCKNMNISESNGTSTVPIIDRGLVTIFDRNWASPKTVSNYKSNIELYSIMANKLFDINTVDPLMATFRANVLDRFEKLITNYQRINMSPVELAPHVLETIKLFDVPKELKSYYLNPSPENVERWNKKVNHISLGSLIRNSPKTGLQEYTRLLEEGYSFDYDTYKTLIQTYPNMIDLRVIQSALTMAPIIDLSFVVNTIISTISGSKLEHYILNNELFASHIFPYLTDRSISRLAKFSKSIKSFLAKVKFPERFIPSENGETEFPLAIESVYEALLKNGMYQQILILDTKIPVANKSILVAAAIKGRDWKKVNSLLGELEGSRSKIALIEVKYQYYMESGQYDEAKKLLETLLKDFSYEELPENSNIRNTYCFGLFVRSFYDTTDTVNTTTTEEMAHALCAQSMSFSAMVSMHDQYMYSNTLDKAPQSNTKIIKILFSDFSAALKLLNASAEAMKAQLNRRLSNLLRFICFLKNPEISFNQLKILIDIWLVVNPHKVTSFVNNCIESIYLNPKTQVIFLEHDLTFHFKLQQLYDLLGYIRLVGKDQESLGKELRKIEQFQNYINDYHFQIA